MTYTQQIIPTHELFAPAVKGKNTMAEDIARTSLELWEEMGQDDEAIRLMVQYTVRAYLL